MTTTTIQKWGNSAAIRIKKHLLEEAGFKIGDTVRIIAKKDRFLITKV